MFPLEVIQFLMTSTSHHIGVSESSRFALEVSVRHEIDMRRSVLYSVL